MWTQHSMKLANSQRNSKRPTGASSFSKSSWTLWTRLKNKTPIKWTMTASRIPIYRNWTRFRYLRRAMWVRKRLQQCATRYCSSCPQSRPQTWNSRPESTRQLAPTSSKVPCATLCRKQAVLTNVSFLGSRFWSQVLDSVPTVAGVTTSRIGVVISVYSTNVQIAKQYIRIYIEGYDYNKIKI